jgi:hypothetical protein
MVRLAPAPPMESVSWVEVSGAAPCPVCGARTGCEVALRDPVYARCRVERSMRPFAEGGWLHIRVQVASADQGAASAA